jgi:hypothetical protein
MNGFVVLLCFVTFLYIDSEILKCESLFNERIFPRTALEQPYAESCLEVWKLKDFYLDK